jgi:hypothetical protein
VPAPARPPGASRMTGLQLGIFLLAGAVLLLEVALTRVFAIMLWHHLAYMVVAVAMLGFGAAGSLLTLAGVSPRERTPAAPLALLATGCGVAAVAALALATRIPLDTLRIWQDRQNLLWLALLYTLLFVPFLLGGAAIGLALTRLAARVNRLYFFDLLGSAAGGCSGVWLLARFGSAATVLLAGVMAALAGAAFATSGEAKLRRGALVPLGLAAAIAALASGALPGLAIEVPYAPGKEFARYVAPGESLRLFSSTAEVEVGPSGPQLAIVGGNFGTADSTATTGRLVGQDGTAPTMLFRNASDLSAFPFLDDSQTAAAYVARAAAGADDPTVLVIGVGGGVDVMIALVHGARSVTAVEINRAMVDMVTRRFDDYLGGLFRAGAHPLADRIELVHGEGRSFVRGSPRRWDVIQLAGVDSFTALNTGAYTLSESYLYTVEAVQDFYSRLAEGGTLSFSRFIMRPPRRARETLRLAAIATTALRELGVDDPASHIAVFQGFGWASTLVKRGRFTAAEVQALREFARREGFWGLVFDPLHPVGTPFAPSVRFDARARLGTERSLAGGALPGLEAAQLDALMSAYRELRAGRREAAWAQVDGLAQGDGGLRARVRRLLLQQAERAAEQDVAFHAVQRDFSLLLRGDAASRRAFVRGYEFDLSPSRDDAPFFFNYYRYAGLLGSSSPAPGAASPYHPDYPVGHLVLLASLLQITALAALLILLPLRRLARRGVPTPGRGRVFAYFAALGAGFMFVEIVLMQKLVLFLGHPTYAVTVVLSTLLACAGLGSLASARLGAPSRRVLGLLLVGVPLLVVAEAAAAGLLLPRLLGWPFAARVGVVVAGLAPLGMVLGMPFPLGVRLLERRAPALVPWGWAINAFLSVFSSIFCIVLAMAVGFSAVLALAAALYALGFAALRSFEASTS